MTRERFETAARYHARGQFQDAARLLKTLLKQNPRNVMLMFNLAATYCSMNRVEEGLKLMREGLRIDGSDPGRWWNYAANLHFAGRNAEAAKVMDRVLDRLPDAAKALYNYCMIARPAPDHAVPERLRGLLASGTLSRLDESLARYGLAHVLDAAGEHDAALDHALAGGAAYGIQCNLDDRAIDRIIRANSRAVLTRQPCGGDPSDAPVFVLGMPRSGTTFTEQILSRHPGILTGGELNGGRIAELLAMSWCQQHVVLGNAHEAVARIPPELEEVAAAHHASLARNIDPGREFLRFTDKLPENAFRLGLLSRMYPNARVIVIHRHPLDTCTSCLFQRFNDIQYSYTNSMETLAMQYRGFQRVLAHWREVLPLRMLEINYESMVDDFEPHVRLMLDFLDLPWEPACLSPQDSTRQVRTASAAQVRDGVNRRSVDKWKRYAHRFGPLIEGLGGMAQIEAWARTAARPPGGAQGSGEAPAGAETAAA